MTPSRQLLGPRAGAGAATSRWRGAVITLMACLCGWTGEADAQEYASAQELKLLTLEELVDLDVTSVSRQVEKVSAAAASVYVITQDDIRRSGATRIPEALRLAPNLQVAQIDSRQWAVTARGFNGDLANKLLVMVDGRTVYTPLYAGVFWDVQDTFMPDIDRIEVISGPGGTVWGANAVNGVINIITKEAKDTQGLLVRGGAGTELHGLAGLRYGGEAAPNLHYRVYLKYFDRDESVFPDGSNADDEWNMGQGGLRMDWKPGDANHLTFQSDIYSGEFSEPRAERSTIDGGNLLTRWTHTLSAESDFTIQGYYDKARRDIPDVFTEDLDTYDLDFQHRFPISQRHSFIWGLGYRLMISDVENSAGLAFLPDELTRHLFSGFVQDEIQIVEDKLKLSLGAKLEHNDYTGFEFQPSARVAWTPVARHTVWSAVSRAVRTPSRIDRHFYVPGEGPTFGSRVQGGEGFDSESLIAYELGYRTQPHEKVALSLTGFFHDYDEIRSSERVSPAAPRPIRVGNGLEAESYGLESSVHLFMTDWWQLRLGYTHLQIYFEQDRNSTDMTSGSGESSDPQDQVFVYSNWDLPANLELNAGFRYISELENQDVPSYTAWDAKLGWRPKENIEVSLLVRNIFDPQHPEFGSAAVRNEIERSVFGMVAWRF